MKKIEKLLIGTDRYKFDFDRCAGPWWAQVDTSQDASYYGHWTNPQALEFVGFVEGDYTHITADTPEEYTTVVRDFATWAKDFGCWRGIDPGLANREALVARFDELGLSHLIH